MDQLCNPGCRVAAFEHAQCGDLKGLGVSKTPGSLKADFSAVTHLIFETLTTLMIYGINFQGFLSHDFWQYNFYYQNNSGILDRLMKSKKGYQVKN